MRKCTPVSSSETAQSRRAPALSRGAPAAVAALALEVVEVDTAHAVRAAADGNDAGVVAAGHPVEEQSSEGEVAEVVGPELELEPVGGHLPGEGSHDAGVVDEQVEVLMFPREPLRETANRSEAGEVERANLDFGGRHSVLDRERGFGALLGVAHGEDDARAGARQLAGGEEADAAVGAGDDG